MNNRPLYENLDTAFVNLSALVKYLRHREFLGHIRVELNNYEADIVLVEGNKIAVREHDKILGRISEGEEAFHRLLTRSGESGGTIHVYHQAAKTQADAKSNALIPPPKTNIETPIVEVKANPAATNQNGSKAKPPKPAEPVKKPQIAANHPKFPFDLSNQVESKARQNRLSERDWQLLLDLTGELLGTIDKSLAESKLDFKIAFTKARSDVSADYPFIHPETKIFEYSNGRVLMHEEISAKLFAASINESLRRIIERLNANPKFADVYRTTAHRILALIKHREAFYEKFFIIPQLKKILGA